MQRNFIKLENINSEVKFNIETIVDISQTQSAELDIIKKEIDDINQRKNPFNLIKLLLSNLIGAK